MYPQFEYQREAAGMEVESTSWIDDEIAFAQMENEVRKAGESSVERPQSLAAFIERSTRYRLDDWQLDLCGRLEGLATGKRGRRVLIHAGPQHGKSIIVSQRYPAWLLTQNPERRIKLACYNVTHATRFGRIVRDLMQSADFIKTYPDPALRLPIVCSAEEWSTAARTKKRDGQPSFKALGLATGFVGQSADDLIIDDPYSSPEEAYSETINAKVHSFWTDTAKPRLGDNANVVVMFHRYTEYDLAGFLMSNEPEEWELWRYPAAADGRYVHPATGREYPDPMEGRREEGDYLSRRYSAEWYEKQRANEYVWQSQFQGRPSSKEGAFFKVAMLGDKPIAKDAVPDRLIATCRAWDLAASTKGDYTAGVKIGVDAENRFYVLDVVRGQWLPDMRDARMRQTAEIDGVQCAIRLAQDPGQAGVDQAQRLVRMLAGYNASYERVSGSKETRADAFAAQVNAGNVRLVTGDWNRAFIEEMRTFPLGRHDDQIDAAADAFSVVARPRIRQTPASSYSFSRFAPARRRF